MFLACSEFKEKQDSLLLRFTIGIFYSFLGVLLLIITDDVGIGCKFFWTEALMLGLGVTDLSFLY